MKNYDLHTIPMMKNGCLMVRNGCPMMKNGCLMVRNGCPMMRNGCLMMRNGCPMVRNGCLMMRNGCPMVRNGCPMMRNGCPMLRKVCFIAYFAIYIIIKVISGADVDVLHLAGVGHLALIPFSHIPFSSSLGKFAYSS